MDRGAVKIPDGGLVTNKRRGRGSPVDVISAELDGIDLRGVKVCGGKPR
jgi:hypothetical protein